MIKKHQCSFCKKVRICINAIPTRIEYKKDKKGEWYIVRGYWLCRDKCYKFKQLGGDIW